MDALRGRCACGAVSVTLSPPAEPREEDSFFALQTGNGVWTALVGHCHCQTCTLGAGGSVMTTDFLVPRRCVTFEGEEHIRTHKTSEHVALRFVRWRLAWQD